MRNYTSRASSGVEFIRMLRPTLLQNVVFAVGNVEFEVFQPWVDFILQVVNEGATCETHTRLRQALLEMGTNPGVKKRKRRSGTSGPGASRQFQRFVRAGVDRELAHLPNEQREDEITRHVLKEFVESLPQVSMGADDEGRACLRPEPTPLTGAEPPTRTQVFGSKAEIARANAEWLSRLATENERKCLAVIAALGADDEARRLLRCNECKKFFVARAAHRRTHNFCCPEHRRAYDLAHRDPKGRAEYMRRWRKLRKRLKSSRARLRAPSR